MAFTTVPTKNTGDVYTSAMWNSYTRDNFNIGSLHPIGGSILGSSAASFDFVSIDQNFVGLLIHLYARGDAAVPDQQVQIRMNNDSGANYATQELRGNLTTVVASGAVAGTSSQVGYVPGSTATAGRFGTSLIFIPAYTDGSGDKPFFSMGSEWSGATTASLQMFNYGGFWAPGVATNITRVTIFPLSGNFVAVSRCYVLGIPF